MIFIGRSGRIHLTATCSSLHEPLRAIELNPELMELNPLLCDTHRIQNYYFMTCNDIWDNFKLPRPLGESLGSEVTEKIAKNRKVVRNESGANPLGGR